MERLVAMGIAGLFAALLCAGALPAQEPPRSPERPPKQADKEPAQVSKEDEALLKDLAVLERLDLLRNLDLFEERTPPPDAGQPRPQ